MIGKGELVEKLVENFPVGVEKKIIWISWKCPSHIIIWAWLTWSTWA